MITYELALVIGFVVLCIFIITALLLKLKGIILSYPKENQKYVERLNKKAELPQQFSFFTFVCKNYFQTSFYIQNKVCTRLWLL